MAPRLSEGHQPFDFPRHCPKRVDSALNWHTLQNKQNMSNNNLIFKAECQAWVQEVTWPHEKKSNNRARANLTVACYPSLSTPCPHLQKGTAENLPLQGLGEDCIWILLFGTVFDKCCVIITLTITISLQDCMSNSTSIDTNRHSGRGLRARQGAPV